MVGQKLAARLRAQDPSADLTLYDIAFPPGAAGGPNLRQGTVTDVSAMDAVLSERFDTIYHLASIVSGEAESNFEKGWDVNLGGMMNFLAALKREHEASGGAYMPKLIFTSSIAVFGGPYPESISDEFHSTPQTSYGAQKAICELMLHDYARKGLLDGVALRLPTICVRPGKPNGAASSFFSGIIREPLNGQEALLPVPDTVRHWCASPRAAAGFLDHAASLSREDMLAARAINLPGISLTVAEMIEALGRVAGNNVVALIKPEHDEAVAKIVSTWPERFDASKAAALGFKAESSFDEIIKVYMEDDLQI